MIYDWFSEFFLPLAGVVILMGEVALAYLLIVTHLQGVWP